MLPKCAKTREPEDEQFVSSVHHIKKYSAKDEEFS